jgi:putative lipoprotein
VNFSLAFVLLTGGVPHRAADPWFGRDKMLHFAASAVVQGAAYSVFRRDARYTVAMQRASLLTVGVGVGKELYDWRHPARHEASWRDLAWDGAGGGVATIALRQAAR